MPTPPSALPIGGLFQGGRTGALPSQTVQRPAPEKEPERKVGDIKVIDGLVYEWNGTNWTRVFDKPSGPPVDDPEAKAWADKMSEGSQPGAGEEWWRENAAKFTQPSTAQDYWAGQSGYFTGPSQYEGPQRAYAGEARDLTALGPGAGEQFYTTDAWKYADQPSITEALRLGNLPGLWQEGAAERFYGGPGQELAGEGTLEDWFAKYGERFTQPGTLTQKMTGIEALIGGATAGQGFGGAALPQLVGPGYTERMAAGFAPEESYSEQFLTGEGPGGLDALMRRQYELGERQLENRAAATGAFGAGASMRLNEELFADLTTQRTLNEMKLREQSDAAKMARFAESRQLMSSADEALRGRLGVGFTGARGMDETALARAGALQGLYGAADESDLARLTAGAGVAGAAQRVGIERLGELGTAAERAQAAEMARTRERFVEARSADEMALERLRAKQSAADLAERARMDRARLGLSGIQTGAKILSNIEDAELRRITAGGQLAGQTSEDALKWLGAQFGGARTVQDLAMGRQAADWDKLFGLTGAMAGSYATGTDRISTEQRDLQMAEIEGLLRDGKITSEQADNMRDMLLQGANIGLRLHEIKSGRPAPAPVGRPAPAPVKK